MNEILSESVSNWEIETVQVPTGYMTVEVPTFKQNGLTVKIHSDEFASCPREFYDTITHFWVGSKCRRNYGLGDLDQADITDEEITEIIKDDDVVFLPVFMLSHSGERLSTSDFNDPWDSGQIGFIYVFKSDVSKEWSIGSDSDSEIAGQLRSEIREMDSWIAGEVYGYEIIDETGETIDACWGFYGFDVVEREAIEALACVGRNRG